MEKKAYHFSHSHQLKLTTYQQTLNNLTSPCSACKLKPSGMIYACTICQDYFLHKKCFEMPKKIDHLCLEDHFACDACGEKGDGFSYNCSRCDIDLHLLCVLLPLFVKHESLVHKLDLAFESPYPSKSFSCGICGAFGSRHWLYRCKLCEFNAHLNCARGVETDPPIRPPVQSKNVTSSIGFDEMSSQLSPKAKEEATSSRLTPSAPQLPPIQQQPNIIMPNNITYGFPSSAPVSHPFEVNRQVNNVLEKRSNYFV